MKVALFIPCYVNALYPEVGEASYRLLCSLGVDVDYPLEQTCCGQPMANAGYEADAKPLAEKMERLFAGYDYVVGPSASCVSFVREGYPRLTHHDDDKECLASHIYEICEFIHDVVRPTKLDARFPHKVSLHNSCHGVRLMRNLLSLVEGVEVVEPERKDECCGFGGLFSIEESAVSKRMAHDKVARHVATGAEYITGADSSCLMNMQGIIENEGLAIRTKHIIEILTAKE